MINIAFKETYNLVRNGFSYESTREMPISIRRYYFSCLINEIQEIEKKNVSHSK